MTNSDVTVLEGLPGDNPLGFFAALGVQVCLNEQGHDVRLHWTDHPIPNAVVSPAQDVDEIATAARATARSWLNGPALDDSLDPKLKLTPDGIRNYLGSARAVGSSAALGSCLLAEESLDNSGKAKPTSLYFTAGQQKFVTVARTILSEVTEEQLTGDVSAPWRYDCRRPSLMWDTADDRLHAYSALDPTSPQNPKYMNPGAEALAVLGLSRYPCFAAGNGTLTQGCSGSWKRGDFVWPLWTVPASANSVRSLLAHVTTPNRENRRADCYAGWSLSRVLSSQIRRSSQGGYGTFGPPRVVWQRE